MEGESLTQHAEETYQNEIEERDQKNTSKENTKRSLLKSIRKGKVLRRKEAFATFVTLLGRRKATKGDLLSSAGEQCVIQLNRVVQLLPQLN